MDSTDTDLGFTPDVAPDDVGFVSDQAAAPSAPGSNWTTERTALAMQYSQAIAKEGTPEYWKPENQQAMTEALAKLNDPNWGKTTNWNGVIADLGLTAGGQAIGTELAGPPGGAAGGLIGNSAAQIRRIYRGEQDTYHPGEALGATISGFNSFGVAKNTIGAFIKAGTFGAGLNTAAAEGQSLLDNQKLLSSSDAAKAAAFGAAAPIVGAVVGGVKSQTPEAIENAAATQRGVENGFVMPVASSNPGGAMGANTVLGAMAGKSRGDITMANAVNATNLAKNALGIPVTSSLSTGALAQVDARVSAGYEAVGDLTGGDDLIRQWKQAHAKINALSDYQTATNITANTDRNVYDEIKQWENQAAIVEAQIDALAKQSNNPGALAQLQAARVLKAKLEVVRGDYNPVTKMINAKAIGKLYKAGVPLTDELKVIGEFGVANPTITGAPETMATSAPGKATATIAALGAASGAQFGGAHFGPAGAIVGGGIGAALPFAGMPASKVVLSPLWQRNFAVKQAQPDLINNFARFLTK